MLCLIHAVKWAEETEKQFKPHLRCNVHSFGSYQNDVTKKAQKKALQLSNMLGNENMTIDHIRFILDFKMAARQ